MKILVSALLFLFLSGTYGASITVQEEKEEPPKPTLRESFKDLLHHTFLLGADLVAHWDSPEAERKAALNKRTEGMKTSYYSFGFSLLDQVVDVYKEVHKEINDTYPVYSNKVFPLIGASFVYGLQALQQATEEIKPYFEKFEEQVKAHQKVFWEEVRPIVQKHTKPVIDHLNANLKPYIEDVRKELAKNQEDSKPPSDQEKYVPLEKHIKTAEVFQKVFLFDEEVLDSMVSQLEIFSTNA